MPDLDEGDAGLCDVHLTGETLLLFQSGELESEEERTASAHLACCSFCRSRLQETTGMLLLMRHAIEWGRLNQLTQNPASEHAPASRFWRGPIRVLGGFAGIAAVLLMVVALLNRNMRTVSANELVNRAVREETRNTRPVSRMRLRDAQGTCTLSNATASSAVVEPACDRMKARLQSANWDSEHWAGSFDRWRASLKRKKDAVSDRQGVLSLRTETSEGSLRAATLNVRPADFHAVSAKLEFVDAEQIEMSELVPDRVLSETAFAPSVTEAPKRIISMEREARLPAAPPADPVDTSEIQVRVVLHEFNVDNGYDARVRRTRQEIEVRGLMPDLVQWSEMEAILQGIPFVRPDVRPFNDPASGEDVALVRRELANPLPALANEWLLRTFRSRDEMIFVNRLMQLSRLLLGEIAVRDELDQRYEALKHNPRAGELVAVMYAHADRLAMLAKSLRRELEPALNSLDATEPVVADSSIQAPPRQPGPLTLEEAHTLDSALTHIFLASRVDAGSLHEEVERVRFLLDAWIP